MNPEKLKKLQLQVRIGGKGTPRRKKKVVHQTAATDDKKLQSSLKKLSVSTIPGIEEVNIIKDDLSVIHFNNPKAQASLSANTFAITGHGEHKKVVEMLPEILPQLGQETVLQLRRFANNMAVSKTLSSVAEEDDVPTLVENFDEASKNEAPSSLKSKLTVENETLKIKTNNASVIQANENKTIEKKHTEQQKHDENKQKDLIKRFQSKASEVKQEGSLHQLSFADALKKSVINSDVGDEKAISMNLAQKSEIVAASNKNDAGAEKSKVPEAFKLIPDTEKSEADIGKTEGNVSKTSVKPSIIEKDLTTKLSGNISQAIKESLASEATKLENGKLAEIAESRAALSQVAVKHNQKEITKEIIVESHKTEELKKGEKEEFVGVAPEIKEDKNVNVKEKITPGKMLDPQNPNKVKQKTPPIQKKAAPTQKANRNLDEKNTMKTNQQKSKEQKTKLTKPDSNIVEAQDRKPMDSPVKQQLQIKSKVIEEDSQVKPEKERPKNKDKVQVPQQQKSSQLKQNEKAQTKSKEKLIQGAAANEKKTTTGIEQKFPTQPPKAAQHKSLRGQSQEKTSTEQEIKEGKKELSQSNKTEVKQVSTPKKQLDKNQGGKQDENFPNKNTKKESKDIKND